MSNKYHPGIGDTGGYMGREKDAKARKKLNKSLAKLKKSRRKSNRRNINKKNTKRKNTKRKNIKRRNNRRMKEVQKGGAWPITQLKRISMGQYYKETSVGRWSSMEGWYDCVCSEEPEFYEMNKDGIDYNIYLCVYYLDYDSGRSHHYAPWKGFIHTGLLFNGIEYFVGPIGQINFLRGGKREHYNQEVTRVGVTVKHSFNYAVYLGKGKLENIEALQNMHGNWDYNMLSHNCNHFSIEGFRVLRSDQEAVQDKVIHSQLEKIFEMNRLRTIFVTYGGYDESNNPVKHPVIAHDSPAATVPTEPSPIPNFLESVQLAIDPEVVHISLLVNPDINISSDKSNWVSYLKDMINQCNGNMDNFSNRITQSYEAYLSIEDRKKEEIVSFLNQCEIEHDDNLIEGIIQEFLDNFIPLSLWMNELKNKVKSSGDGYELD